MASLNGLACILSLMLLVFIGYGVREYLKRPTHYYSKIPRHEDLARTGIPDAFWIDKRKNDEKHKLKRAESMLEELDEIPRHEDLAQAGMFDSFETDKLKNDEKAKHD